VPHIQTVSQDLTWEHSHFCGRRIGGPNSPDEESRLRYWGVDYSAYASGEDAKWLRNQLIAGQSIRVYGSLMDRFFYNQGLGQYTQTEAQVYACLHWWLTENPTETELALTDNMQQIRARMSGATLFSGTPYAFTVTDLPEERTPEEQQDEQ